MEMLADDFPHCRYSDGGHEMTLIINKMLIEAVKHKLIPGPHGRIEMWTLVNDGPGDCISIGIPEGRTDLIDFVERSMKAGQNLLRVMPPGFKFSPDEGNMSNFVQGMPKPPPFRMKDAGQDDARLNERAMTREEQEGHEDE
jgi:hypothetical protein